MKLRHASTRAVGWRGILISLLFASGTWLAAGPLASLSMAQGCDDSWAGAVSGNWADAADWTAGVPTSTQNVCITASGTYTVTLTGPVTVASLTLGGGSNGQTLAISTSHTNGASITLNGDSTNSGTLEETDSDSAGAGSAEAQILIGNGATLTNSGTIISDPGAAGQGTRAIDGHNSASTLVNTSSGTITVNQDLEIDSTQNGLFTTSGNITIASGEKLLVDPAGSVVGGNPPATSAELDIDGGTITDHGTFEQGISETASHASGAALAVNGGTITGGPLIVVGGTDTDIAGTGVGASFSDAGSGTYIFVGSSSANATTLGGTIGANQTVVLSANAANGNVPMQVNSNVTNDGTLELTDSDTSGTNQNMAEIKVGTGDTLTNDGTILSDPGPAGAGQRVITGSGSNTGTLDNASGGTITVNQDLQIDTNQDGVFTTSGDITVSSAEKLLFAPNGGFAGGNPTVYTPTMDIAGGTIIDNGTFAEGVNETGGHAGGAALNVSGGAITGSFVVVDGGPASFANAGSGTYTFEGSESAASTALSGTIGSGQTVVVSANNAFGGVGMVASADVTNNGTLEFTDPDASGAGEQTVRLRMDSGTLINNGTFIAEHGGGGDGFYAIDGNLTNASTGTFDVNQTLEVDTQANPAFNVQTSGTLNVASGQTLYVNTGGSGSVFTISGGAVTNTGHIDVNIGPTNGQALISGGLVVDGGTVTGNPVLAGDVGASFAGTGTGTFVLVGQQTLLSGDIATGCTVVLSGSSSGAGSTTATTSASFTNHGTIELTDPDPSGSGPAQSQLVVQGGTLTNAGRILSDPGPAGLGEQSIAGTIVNTGTVTVNETLTQTRGQFTNQGTVTVAGGQTFTVASSFPQTAGTMTVAANGTLVAPGGVNLQGGTLLGAGTIAGNVENAGEVSPSPSPARLTIDGTYTQTAGGFLTAQATSTGADELSVTGAASLGGTLAMSNASGFTPTPGQQYKVVGAGSVTGQFVGVTGPYSATYDAADVTVTATEVTGAALSIGDVSVDEPAFGTATATFTVTLSAARTSPVTVDYATSNGTAIAGQDYQAAAGGLTFAPGQTTQTIPVTVIGGDVGPTATFFVDLSNATGASFANNQATGTIVRKPPSVSGAVSPSTGGNAGTVTVTIQGGGLFGSPTVALTAPGEPDIVAQSTAASRDGSSVTATFDLTGAPLGPRTVVVSNPGASSSLTIPNSFTIVPAIAPTIQANISGPAAIGPNAAWNGVLLYQNLGNVDAYDTQIQITGLPAGTAVNVQGGDGEPIISDIGDQLAVTITIDQIAADGTGAVGISFQSPAGQIGKSASMSVNVLGTSSVPTAPGPSITHTTTIISDTPQELIGVVHVDVGGTTGDMSVDEKWVPAPASGQPSITESNSDGQVTITELAPPAPSPAPFNGSAGLCGGTITVGGGIGAVAAPLVGCSSFATVVAAADSVSPALRPAVAAPSIGDWIKTIVTEGYNLWGKIRGGADAASSTTNSAYLRTLVACLVKGKYIGPGQADLLLSPADIQSDAKIASFAANWLENPAVSFAAGQAADALADAGNSVFANDLQTIISNNVGFTPNPFVNQAVKLAGDDAAQTLLNALKACGPRNGCTPPTKAADIAPRQSSAGSGEFCPVPPPPPPPFPIEIRASLDPNEMIGPSGAGARHWVRGSPLFPYTYTARFQNTPTATAPAYQVRVVDTLSGKHLNLSTLHLGPVTLGSQVITPPPGVQSWSTQVDLRPAKNIIVRVSGSLDPSTGVLSWVFETIDASTGQPVTDVTNGFLPPDVTPPQGEGSVSFTVTREKGLRTGTRIANQATIYFDTNAPITTQAWVNTIDVTPPRSSRITKIRHGSAILRVHKGRATAKRRFPALIVGLSGRDRASGVASFDLFASKGNAKFREVAAAVPAKQVRFPCVAGRSYRFYVVAIDAAGNVQLGHSRPSRPVTCG